MTGPRTRQPHEGRTQSSDFALVAAAREPQFSSRPIQRRPAASFRVSVLRPDDLVAFELECVEFDVVTEGTSGGLESARRTVLRPRAGEDALLVVHLAPQHVGERAYFEADPPMVPPRTKPDDAPQGVETESPGPPPVPARFANPSRLVFEVPHDYEVEYTVEGLLRAFRELRMRVAWTAVMPPGRRFPLEISELLSSLVSEALTSGDAAVRTRAAQALALTSAHLLTAPDDPVALGRAEAEGRAAGIAGALADTIDAAIDVFRIKPFPTEPQPHETAIEAPFRLILSPNVEGRWEHAPEPVASSEPDVRRVELWHSRLVADVVHPIWNRHRMEEAKHEDTPFRMSLDDRDRTMIVDLSVDQTLTTTRRGVSRPYRPQPVESRRLMLSAFGAWLDLRGEWEPRADGYSLAEWVHRAPMGRDQYVKVVYAGVLYPFGHPASLIKITERRIDRSQGAPVAYLFQHMYIVVRQPVMTYGARRDFPYSSIRLTTLVTPNIDLPSKSALFSNRYVFWPSLAPTPPSPTVPGPKFDFHCIGVDAVGNESHFDTPLIFIEDGAIGPGASMTDVQDAFRKAADNDPATRDPDFGGQAVAFALPSILGDTSYEVRSMGFDAALSGATDFRPVMRRASVLAPAVKSLTGKDDPLPVRYYSNYLTSGLGPGEVFLEVDKALSTPAVDFAGAADRAGGLARPNFDISGLSRQKGPVGGALATAQSGGFNPNDFFGGGQGPLLFGVFSLADVVNGAAPKFVTESLDALTAFRSDAARLDALVQQVSALGGVGSLAAFNAARTTLTAAVQDASNILDHLDLANPAPTAAAFVTHASATQAALVALLTEARALPLPPSLAAQIETRAAVVEGLIAASGPVQTALQAIGPAAGLVQNLQRTRLEWSPRLTSFPNDEAMWIFGADDSTHFNLAVEVRQKTADTPPGFDIESSLERFRIRLLPPMPLMVLHFDRIAFRSRDGKKPDVDVVFGGIEFVGILSFVETLKKVIPLDGFSDPPSLEVGADGVKAGFSLAIPTVAVGVFSLENVSLGSDFRVPFIGDPVSVGFNFCTRERPFTLTVSLLGGGGFFGIRVSPKGVMLLEAAIEFGAALSVNLGVASGSVSIMAGIYFKMENDACSLTGYFRLRGEVDVLGLISASIELYLGLTYEFSTGKMAGKASLTIEIEILFFSTSVQVTCERKFAGAHGDPTFVQLMDPADTGGPTSPWYAYCEAFAEA